MEELDFIKAVLAEPTDYSSYLIFADWLEEHNDPRCDFTRLVIARASLTCKQKRNKHTKERLRQLIMESGKKCFNENVPHTRIHIHQCRRASIYYWFDNSPTYCYFPHNIDSDWCWDCEAVGSLSDCAAIIPEQHYRVHLPVCMRAKSISHEALKNLYLAVVTSFIPFHVPPSFVT